MEASLATSHRLNAKSAHRSAVIVSREQQHLQRQVTGIEKQKRQAANELRFLQNKLIDRAAAKHLVPHNKARDTLEQRPRSSSSPALFRRTAAPGPYSHRKTPEGTCCSPKPGTLPTPSTNRETLSLPPVLLNPPAGWDPGRRSTIGCLRDTGDGLSLRGSFDSLKVTCVQKSPPQKGKPIQHSRSQEDMNDATMAAGDHDKPVRYVVSQPNTVFFYSSNMTPHSPTIGRKNQLLNVKEAMGNISNLQRWSSGPELRNHPDVEKPDMASMGEHRYIRLPPARNSAARQETCATHSHSG